MSIINDALKKAQREKNAPGPTRAEVGVELQFQKKHGFNWGPVFILAVLFLIGAPILLPLVMTPFKQQAYLNAASEKTTVVGQTSLSDAAIKTIKMPIPPLGNITRKAQFGIEETLGTSVPATALQQGQGPLAVKSSFNLSGIVFSPQESYCIVNDQIVKTGERIGGAKLLEITPDKVTLDYQGRLITLEQ